MIDTTELDRPGTLAAADAVLTAQHRLDADQLALAAHWADLHHPDSIPPATTTFEQRRRRLEGVYPVQPAGDGTPAILAACPAELGLVLRTNPTGARHLIADALDLRHRLPLLWADVQAGGIRAWKARKVAQATRHLPHHLMADVDASLVGLLNALPWARFQAVLDATVAHADPAGARHAEDEAAARRYVTLGRDRSHGLLTVIARGEVLDILTFLAAVNRIADLLELDGDPDHPETVEVRRSRAVGLLGQPDRALALLRTHADDPDRPPALAEPDQPGPTWRARRGSSTTSAPDLATEPGENDGHDEHEPGPTASRPPDLSPAPTPADADEPVHEPAGGPGPEPEPTERGTRSIDLDEPTVTATGSAVASIRVQLHVHLTDTALSDTALNGADPAAVARVEGVDPVTAATVRRWLARADARITVRPVVVPGDAIPADAYEIPHTVRQAVLLREPATTYPWGTSTDRPHLQLDHIQPYLDPARGGPPGQTRPANLAPLTGPEHQNKTHRHWSTHAPAPGVHLWRSPHGWITLVTNQGTFPLGNGPTARSIWRAAAPVSELVRAA